MHLRTVKTVATKASIHVSFSCREMVLVGTIVLRECSSSGLTFSLVLVQPKSTAQAVNVDSKCDVIPFKKYSRYDGFINFYNEYLLVRLTNKCRVDNLLLHSPSIHCEGGYCGQMKFSKGLSIFPAMFEW